MESVSWIIRGMVAGANSSNFAAENGLMIDAEDLFTSSYIKSISSFSDGRMLVSGAFSAYYSWNGYSPASKKDRVYGDNIMILNSNASADTICRVYWETENNWAEKKYVGQSALNGGATQEIIRSFVTSDQKIVAVGNFTQYVCTEYAYVFEDNAQRKTDVASVFRMDEHGKLDSLYRLVVPGNRYTGAREEKCRMPVWTETTG